MSTYTLRLYRMAAVAIVVAVMTVGWAGGVTAQDVQDKYGDTWVDQQFRWSVEVAPDVWRTEDFQQAEYDWVGLLASTTDGSALISVFPYPDDRFADLDACVDEQARKAAEINDQMEPATSVEVPASDPDAAGDLYTGLQAFSTTEEIVIYLECRELEGGFLSLVTRAPVATYDDAIRPIEALLASVDTTGKVVDDRVQDLQELEIDDGLTGGDTFGSAEYGLLIEWDADVWSAEEKEGGLGVVLSSQQQGAFAVGQIDVRPDLDGTDVTACLDTLTQELFASTPGAIFEIDTSIPFPASDDDVASMIYTWTFVAEDGSAIPVLNYLECRQLRGGEALAIQFMLDRASYEDQRTALSTLLTGILVVPVPYEAEVGGR